MELGRSLLVNSVVPKQEKTNNLPVANETETGQNHHSELQRAATLKNWSGCLLRPRRCKGLVQFLVAVDKTGLQLAPTLALPHIF